MFKKLFIRFFVAIFIILGLMFVLFPQTLSNIYMYYNRDSGFKKVAKGTQVIYLLGTYHSGHWSSSSFSLQNLRAVIENLHPDIVMVESRQDQIDNDNLADGPPEMLFCDLVARETGIQVKGIDWWQANVSTPNTTDEIRDKNINSNILKYSNGKNKILVLFGREHVQIELNKLEDEGYHEEKFTNKQKDNFFKYKNENPYYPKGMDFYIKKRIEYEKESIGTVYKTKEFIDSANSIISNLEDLSKKVEEAGER